MVNAEFEVLVNILFRKGSSGFCLNAKIKRKRREGGRKEKREERQEGNEYTRNKLKTYITEKEIINEVTKDRKDVAIIQTIIRAESTLFSKLFHSKLTTNSRAA